MIILIPFAYSCFFRNWSMMFVRTIEPILHRASNFWNLFPVLILRDIRAMISECAASEHGRIVTCALDASDLVAYVISKNYISPHKISHQIFLRQELDSILNDMDFSFVSLGVSPG